MKNFIKIMLLMVLGFGMGAIAATLKKPRVVEQPVAASPATAGDIAAATKEIKVAQELADPDAASLTGAGEVSLGTAIDDDAPAAVIVKPTEIKKDEPVTPEDIKTDAFSVPAPVAQVTPEAVEAKPAETTPAEATPVVAEPVAAPAPAASSPAPAVNASFLLTDHNGVAVTEKSWPGKYLLVFFGFTHCPDICPSALEKFTVLLGKLGADASKLQILFITVDPARDTAPVMKEYTGNFSKAILGLTGTDEQVKAAIAAFKVYAAKGEEATAGHYLMDHSGFSYLVAPDGQMKEVLKSSESAAEMARKVGAVLSPIP